MKCWGRGDNGRLGNGGTTDSHTPVECGNKLNSIMRSSRVVFLPLALEHDHTCAVTNTGNVKCWGHGQITARLGNGGNYRSKLCPRRCLR